MTKISEWFVRKSTGTLALIATVVFIVFLIVVLPDQAAKAEEYSQGSGSPDTSFFYTPDRLFELAEQYGEEGRKAYVRARFTFDLIFPLVYGVFLVTTIGWILKITTPPGSSWQRFALIPIIGVIFDLLENISTSLVMIGYPERRMVAAQLAPIFTLIKWVFVNGSFVILLAAVGYWAFRKLRRVG